MSHPELKDEIELVRDVAEHSTLDFLVGRLKNKGYAKWATEALINALLSKIKENLRDLKFGNLSGIERTKELMEFLDKDLLNCMKDHIVI